MQPIVRRDVSLSPHTRSQSTDLKHRHDGLRRFPAGSCRQGFLRRQAAQHQEERQDHPRSPRRYPRRCLHRHGEFFFCCVMDTHRKKGINEKKRKKKQGSRAGSDSSRAKDGVVGRALPFSLLSSAKTSTRTGYRDTAVPCFCDGSDGRRGVTMSFCFFFFFFPRLKSPQERLRFWAACPTCSLEFLSGLIRFTHKKIC